MTAVASNAAAATSKPGVDRDVMAVFAGLMLGSLIASLNMTLVAPALPTIVAELGGLADYSWIPISAMLASTIVVPVAGKLSDIYGRKPFRGSSRWAPVTTCSRPSMSRRLISPRSSP